MENNLDYKKMYEEERLRRINIENDGYKKIESDLKSTEKIFMKQVEDSGINEVAKQFKEQAGSINLFFDFIKTEEFKFFYKSWSDKNK